MLDWTFKISIKLKMLGLFKWIARFSEQEPETFASYTHCFRCGSPTINFVPAKPGDVLTAESIPAAVGPEAWQ